MMLLPLYAVLTWYFCFRFRRRAWGWLALGVSLMLIAMVMMIERRVRTWVGAPDNAFTSLQFVLWGEVIIVGLGGAFILCLRRGSAEVPCRKCGYELAGLEVENPRCPECGLGEAAFRPDQEPPRHVRHARQRLRTQYAPATSSASAPGPAMTPILQR
jgi:hypothetical protein